MCMTCSHFPYFARYSKKEDFWLFPPMCNRMPAHHITLSSLNSTHNQLAKTTWNMSKLRTKRSSLSLAFFLLKISLSFSNCFISSKDHHALIPCALYKVLSSFIPHTRSSFAKFWIWEISSSLKFLLHEACFSTISSPDFSSNSSSVKLKEHWSRVFLLFRGTELSLFLTHQRYFQNLILQNVACFFWI